MSGVRRYRVEITGLTSLLQHADDIAWADEMDRWRQKHKKDSRAGDDRSPAHRWIGSLYRDEKDQIIIPTEAIMRSLMEAGAQVPVPGGRHGKTFKAQTQSGIMPRAIGWPLIVRGRPLSFQQIRPLLSEPDFEKHQEAVEALGFTLYLKRARIGAAKHIRVRPRFDDWAAAGELVVSDDQITGEALEAIIYHAGHLKGLGDWRPSSPRTPGNFGLFEGRVQLA